MIVKKRYDYLDVMKTLGFFFVYISHIGVQSGHFFNFGFYTIAMFFFVSGCTERLSSKELSFKKYLLKKSKSLLIPYFFFSIIALIMMLIDFDNYSIAPKWGLQILRGAIRNEYFAGTMWFLSCLFVISILFRIITMFRNNYISILICFGAYLTAELILPESPLSKPSWYWNVDSALEYIIYYGIGYVCFPLIAKLIENEELKSRILKTVIAVITLVYSILNLAGHNAMNILFRVLPALELLSPLMENLMVIIAFIAISVWLQQFDYLRLLGCDSLYLCGNNFIVGKLLDVGLSIIGIGLAYKSPLAVIMMATLLMVFQDKFLKPIEKQILNRLG